jgi:hypothetical protein
VAAEGRGEQGEGRKRGITAHLLHLRHHVEHFLQLFLTNGRSGGGRARIGAVRRRVGQVPTDESSSLDLLRRRDVGRRFLLSDVDEPAECAGPAIEVFELSIKKENQRS